GGVPCQGWHAIRWVLDVLLLGARVGPVAAGTTAAGRPLDRERLAGEFFPGLFLVLVQDVHDLVGGFLAQFGHLFPGVRARPTALEQRTDLLLGIFLDRLDVLLLAVGKL